ncbi:MAG: polysaccharide biosynthesis/export family protein [Thermodesulfobacteriota bacterium]
MARLVYAGIIGSLVFFISTLMAYPQTDKEVVLKKESQAEGVADRDHYVIGCEDVLYIHVWKEDTLSRSVPVRMDGNISLPLIRDIKAAGLTPLQLEAAITERLKGFFENPTVSVTVMETNSFKVYVSGEVIRPGVYRLRSETTILQIIPMAGGFTEWAKQKKILVIRKENGKEKRFTVDYKKAMKGDDPSSNVILKPGDTIVVEASRLKPEPVSPHSVFTPPASLTPRRH